METLDLIIIGVYFVAMVAVGLRFARQSATDAEAYFLGGKRLPWWALSMSGSVSNFDITGTMWIVSLIVLLGMRSMWVHWIWGFLLGAFFLSYMGRWVRQSGVMTAAEWMKTRFGEDRGGRAARYAYALMAVLVTVSAVGYAYQGIGKFAAVYIPMEQWLDAGTDMGAWLIGHEADLLAILVIGLTTLYVLFGGLFSVVVTDVIQTVILTLGSLVIGYIAWQQLTPEQLSTLPAGFAEVTPRWKLELADPKANAEYGFFGALVLVWVAKGLLLNLGGPGQMYDFQRFLAARTPRDAAKVGAAWSAFLVVRWGMAMGIALIALCVVGGAHPDPEQVMPMVLRDFLPTGIRGLVIAGLLAAFMSTFSSTVNAGASFVVRDLYTPWRRKPVGDREAVRIGYIATIALVLLGIAFGYQGESINAIWQWTMMALTGGVVVPNVLRWYWWRLNGWGYTIGTLVGLLPAMLLLLPESATPAALQLPYVFFPLIVGVSLTGCVVTSLLTAPTDRATLQTFYERIKPFGLWGSFTDSVPRLPAERPAHIALNLLLSGTAILSLYLLPMYLVGHWYLRATLCALLAAATITTLYFTWYRTLPPDPAD